MAKVLLLALVGLIVWGYRNVRLRATPPRPASKPNPGPTQRDSARRPSDPYTVLGIRPGASPEEVRRAYHHLAREYHPDTLARAAPELRRIAEQRMAEINAAYQALRSD
jgi:preprotein translocase subunit Sec63